MFKTCSVLQNIAGDLMFWFNHWKQKPPRWILAECTISNSRFRHLLNLNGSEIEKHKATSREDRRWKTSSEQQFTSNYSHLKPFFFQNQIFPLNVVTPFLKIYLYIIYYVLNISSHQLLWEHLEKNLPTTQDQLTTGWQTQTGKLWDLLYFFHEGCGPFTYWVYRTAYFSRSWCKYMSWFTLCMWFTLNSWSIKP